MQIWPHAGFQLSHWLVTMHRLEACCGMLRRKRSTQRDARRRTAPQRTATHCVRCERTVSPTVSLVNKIGEFRHVSDKIYVNSEAFCSQSMPTVDAGIKCKQLSAPPGAIIRRSLRNANAYIVHVTELRRHSGSNSISSICSGFAVRLCVKQFRNKSATNRTSGVWALTAYRHTIGLLFRRRGDRAVMQLNVYPTVSRDPICRIYSKIIPVARLTVNGCVLFMSVGIR